MVAAFSTYSSAPAAIAAGPIVARLYAEYMAIFISGEFARIAAAASRPSMTGMAMSSRIRSGCC